MLRSCLDCGKISEGSRCPEHAAQRERARPPRPTMLVRDKERKARARAVAAWRAVHGDWCPGWGDRPAHAVVPPNILTADHIIPVAQGGAGAPLAVLCRVCNGAQSGR
jgi:5-methylcytosine-specific restriction protein A